MQQGFDAVNEAAEDVAESSQELENELEDAAESIEDVGEESRKSGSKVEKFGSYMDKASENAADLKSELSKLGGVAKSAFSGVSKFAGSIVSTTLKGIAATGTAAAGLIGYGINYNSDIEQYQTSFEVMTGSAEKAYQTIERLKKMGAETPFELSDLAEATQLLINYGFTADDAIDQMSMLGDISQGNKDKMLRIATAYGQMSSAGKVLLEDVKQMIEAGFNPLQEISETTGESMESLYQRISSGEITVEEITASIKRSTSEGGKYFQSMEKQSKTASGQISTLKDNFSQLAGTISKDASSALSNEFLPMLNKTVEGLKTAFESGGFDALAKSFGTAIANLVKIGADKLPGMINIGSDIIKNIIQGIEENSDSIFDSFLDVLVQVPDFLVDNLGSLLEVGGLFIDKIAGGIIENADSLADSAVSMIMMFIDFIKDNAPKIIEAAKAIIIAFADAVEEQIPSLAPFASIVKMLAENLEAVAVIGIEAVKAVAGFKVLRSLTGTVTNFAKAVKAAKDGIGIFKTAIGLLGGPVSAAIGVIGGLITAITTYKKVQETEFETAVSKITESVRKQNDELKNTIDSYNEMKEEAQKAADADLAMIGHTEDLWEELQTLVDQNGKVKDGYEDRVDYILGELSSATGIEISLVDGVIQKYDELKTSIEEVIDKQKAQALMNAYQPLYEEALIEEAEGDQKIHAYKNTIRESQGGLNQTTQQLINDLIPLANSTVSGAAGYQEIIDELKSNGISQENFGFLSESLGSAFPQAEVKGWLNSIDEANAGIAMLQDQTKETTYQIDLMQQAGALMSQGKYDEAYQLLETWNDVNEQVIQNSESTDEQVKQAYVDKMQTAIDDIDRYSGESRQKKAEEAIQTANETFNEMRKNGIEVDEKMIQDLKKQFEGIDGVDTSQFDAFWMSWSLTTGEKTVADFCQEFGQKGEIGMAEAGGVIGSSLKTTVDPYIDEIVSRIQGIRISLQESLAEVGNLFNPGSTTNNTDNSTHNTTYNTTIHSTPSSSIASTSSRLNSYSKRINGGKGGGQNNSV